MCVFKQQGNAPYCAKTNYDVNNSADNPRLTTTQERYKVKLEDTNKSPVNSPDNQKGQGYFINHFITSINDFKNSLDQSFTFIRFLLGIIIRTL